MPTITISRKVLEKIIGKKIPEDKLNDRISMLGTDLEHMDSDEITVEIFPNRPDMLSEQGFGRALSSFVGTHPGLRKYTVKNSGEKVFVSPEMKAVRPYTVCAIVKNLKLNDDKLREIIQIQEKLHITFCRKRKKAAIGIYPMEKIRMPIYYEAKKPQDIVFRPLEYPTEINGFEIVEKHPAGQAYGHLLKGMGKFALFRDADGNILSIPPIINSHTTGKITEETEEVFIEVSGSDLHTAGYVLNILVCALADMGADIYTMEVVYHDKTITTPDLSARKMQLDIGFINKWLGLGVKDSEIKALLEKMGYGYEKGFALVPPYRPDVIHMVDLAEDIAVAYGYENFKPIIPSKATTGKEDDFEKFRKKISYILAGLGMLETNSYHISNREIQLSKMNISGHDFVELANSKSEEFSMMRYSMLANLMQILGENTHHDYPQNIFESGYVFRKDPKLDSGVRENCRLACIQCGTDADYTKARQVLDYLLRMIGLSYEIRQAEHASFISGRAAKVMVNGQDAGYIGEISPAVLGEFKVEMPACGFEIDLGILFAH